MVPVLLEVDDWRYGFFEPLGLAVVGEFVEPLLWLAGAKVLPKLDPGPVAAEGSGSSIGSRRTVAACDGYVRRVPCVFHLTFW